MAGETLGTFGESVCMALGVCAGLRTPTGVLCGCACVRHAGEFRESVRPSVCVGSCVIPCVTSMCLCGFLGPEILKVPRLLLCGCLGMPRVTLHLWAWKLATGVCFGACGLTGLCSGVTVCVTADLRWCECTEAGSSCFRVCIESKGQDCDSLCPFQP